MKPTTTEPTTTAAVSRAATMLITLAANLNEARRSSRQRLSPDGPPFGEEAVAQRWRSLFARELDDVNSVVRRIENDPGSVSKSEIVEATGWAKELTRLFFADRLREFQGQWVAVVGNHVIDASPDRAQLIASLPRNPAEVPLVFLVQKDGTPAG